MIWSWGWDYEPLGASVVTGMVTPLFSRLLVLPSRKSLWSSLFSLVPWNVGRDFKFNVSSHFWPSGLSFESNGLFLKAKCLLCNGRIESFGTWGQLGIEERERERGDGKIRGRIQGKPGEIFKSGWIIQTEEFAPYIPGYRLSNPTRFPLSSNTKRIFVSTWSLFPPPFFNFLIGTHSSISQNSPIQRIEIRDTRPGFLLFAFLDNVSCMFPSSLALFESSEWIRGNVCQPETASRTLNNTLTSSLPPFVFILYILNVYCLPTCASLVSSSCTQHKELEVETAWFSRSELPSDTFTSVVVVRTYLLGLGGVRFVRSSKNLGLSRLNSPFKTLPFVPVPSRLSRCNLDCSPLIREKMENAESSREQILDLLLTRGIGLDPEPLFTILRDLMFLS